MKFHCGRGRRWRVLSVEGGLIGGIIGEGGNGGDFRPLAVRNCA